MLVCCVLFFPFSSSFKTVTLSQDQGHGKRKASHISNTCFRGQHKREGTYCVPGAGKHALKSATYKESSHPDASHISSATQNPQLSADWVQNEPHRGTSVLTRVHALPAHTEGRRYLPYYRWPSPATVTGLPSD